MHKGEREIRVERRRRRQFLGVFSLSCRDQVWFKKKKEDACKRLRYGNLTKTPLLLCLGLEKNFGFVSSVLGWFWFNLRLFFIILIGLDWFGGIFI